MSIKYPRQPIDIQGFQALATFEDSESSFYVSLGISIIELKIRFRSQTSPIEKLNFEFDNHLKRLKSDPTLQQYDITRLDQIIHQLTTQTSNVEQSMKLLNDYTENESSIVASIEMVMRLILLTLFQGNNNIVSKIRSREKLNEYYSEALEAISSHFNLFIKLYTTQYGPEVKQPKVNGTFPVIYFYQDQTSYFNILYTKEQDDFDKNSSNNTLHLMTLNLNQGAVVQGPPMHQNIKPALQPLMPPSYGPPGKKPSLNHSGSGGQSLSKIVNKPKIPIMKQIGSESNKAQLPVPMHLITQKCMICKKDKLIEEFKVIECPKKSGCNICSFCRKKKSQDQCINCQRYYSDNDKILLTLF